MLRGDKPSLAGDGESGWLSQLSLHFPAYPFPYLADALFLSLAPSQSPQLVPVKAEDAVELTHVEMGSGLEELCVMLGAPIPGGAWQGGMRTEEGTRYFGSCKALTLLSQKRTEPGKPLSLPVFSSGACAAAG